MEHMEQMKQMKQMEEMNKSFKGNPFPLVHSPHNEFSTFMKNKEEVKNPYFLCNNLDKAVYDVPSKIEFPKTVDKTKEEKKSVFLFGMNDKQKEEAAQLKIDKVMENEIYLKKNKVLKYIIQIFLADLLKEKPEDVYNFCANYFTQPNLRQYIGLRLREILKR